MALERLDISEVSIIRGPKGDKGDTGPQGPSGPPGIDGRDGIDGKDGKDGKDGVDGRDGRDGKDGVTVTRTEIDLQALRDAETKWKSELDRLTKELTKLAKRRPEGSSGGGGGSSLDGEIVVTFDGGGSVLSTGDTKVYYTLPYDASIEGWYLTGDPSGSMGLDVWAAFGGIPTNADSITASAKPTLTATNYSSSKALNGWKLAHKAGTVFGFEVESASTLTKAVLTIKLQRV